MVPHPMESGMEAATRDRLEGLRREAREMGLAKGRGRSWRRRLAAALVALARRLEADLEPAAAR